MLLNLGVIELVIHLVKGISRTPRARSSIPGVEVVALCNWEEKRCSICASNVFISSDMMFLSMSSTFIGFGKMGPAGEGVRSGVERRRGIVSRW